MTTTKCRTSTSLVLLIAAIAVGACSGKGSAVSDSATTASAAAASAAPTSGAPAPAPADSNAGRAASGGSAPADPSTFSDANILAKEIAGDSAEVVLAGLAKTMATDPAVKAYAAQLVADHSKGMKETVALATKLSIAPETPAGDTTALGTSHMQTRLQGLDRGPAFDTVFVNHEVEDHKDDIKDATAMHAAAKNPQLKALIGKSLPELQKHLDRAQKLAARAK